MLSESEPTRLDPGPRPTPRERHGVGHASADRAHLADDAPGRVELFVVRSPADVLEPADPPAPVSPAHPTGQVIARLMGYEGWIAVAILAAALIGIFVLGLWFTR